MKAIVPYLNFDGNCKEAMTFYAKCLGAELELHPFSDMPGNLPPGAANRTMHARLRKGSAELMASDTIPGTALQRGNASSVSVHCESREEIDSLFTAMGEGGKVLMPLEDQFWGARFGMITDKIGVQWMFNYQFPK